MLDPREEAKFDELKGMFRDLKLPPPPEIFIGLQVHKDGELIFDDKQRGHSWTRNFYNYKCMIGTNARSTSTLFGIGYLSGKDTTGAYNAYLYNMSGDMTTGAVGAARGIVVGTSDTAFNIDQYALGALIAHGTGVGQLTYQASAFDSKAYASKVWTATSKRVFNNNSGGDITVKEIGLYGYTVYNGWLTLHERSVLSPTVLVPNGAQLTATYEISMDFSSID
jgi:hypothetical protein